MFKWFHFWYTGITNTFPESHHKCNNTFHEIVNWDFLTSQRDIWHTLWSTKKKTNAWGMLRGNSLAKKEFCGKRVIPIISVVVYVLHLVWVHLYRDLHYSIKRNWCNQGRTVILWYNLGQIDWPLWDVISETWCCTSLVLCFTPVSFHCRQRKERIFYICLTLCSLQNNLSSHEVLTILPSLSHDISIASVSSF